MKLKKNR